MCYNLIINTQNVSNRKEDNVKYKPGYRYKPYKYKIDIDSLIQVKEETKLFWYQIAEMIGINPGALSQILSKGGTAKRENAEKIEKWLKERNQYK